MIQEATENPVAVAAEEPINAGISNLEVLRRRVSLLQSAADAYEQIAQTCAKTGDQWLAQFGHVAAAEIDLANLSLAAGFSGPLNGQYLRTRIVEAIFDICSITEVVETGTFRGTTTEYFAHKVKGNVYTCESQPRYWLYANRRLSNFKNVELQLIDSRPFLRSVFSRESLAAASCLCYLDAHWEQDLPLAEEIDIVLSHHRSTVVLIDDFEVPGDCSYGFDDYGPGKKLCLELFHPFRDRIFDIFFPAFSGLADSGARRGYVVFASSADMNEKLKIVPGLRAATAEDWALYGL